MDQCKPGGTPGPVRGGTSPVPLGTGLVPPGTGWYGL